jgi:hypothetical protein
MKTASVLLAAAAAALLATACAHHTSDDDFADKVWEGSKDTTDQVADETMDAMKKAGDKGEGFFDNLWK